MVKSDITAIKNATGCSVSISNADIGKKRRCKSQFYSEFILCKDKNSMPSEHYTYMFQQKEQYKQAHGLK
eukprot:11472741-Ditylum_brightwellii.AAC.1